MKEQPIFKVYLPYTWEEIRRKDSMIVKTELVGGYVWIEHDDSVGLEGRIYILHTQAPGHGSFAMGWALARDVARTLIKLTTQEPVLTVGDTVNMPETRPPTFWEWFRRKRVVQYRQDWKITEAVSND